MVIFENELIDILNLTNKVTKKLKTEGIKTLKDFNELDKKMVLDISNLRETDLKEVISWIEKIENNEVEIFKNGKELTEKNYFYNDDGKCYIDFKLNKNSFSKKTFETLTSNGMFSISDIIFKDNDYFLGLNISKRTSNQITSQIEKIELKEYIIKPKDINYEKDKLFKKIYFEISEKFKISANDLYKRLSNSLDKYLNEKENTCLTYIISKNIFIKEESSKFIREILKSNLYGANKHFILNEFPIIIRDEELISECLNTLILEGEIKFENSLYSLTLSSFETGIKNNLKEIESKILLKRIQGLTLQEIGDGFGVTRERVRQIENKAIKTLDKNDLMFKEDVLSEIYENYILSEEDFIIAFDNIKNYNYLKIRYKYTKKEQEDKKELKFALEDETIPEFYKRKIEKAVYKDYVKLNKSYIKAEKENLIEFILKKYAKTDLKMQDFLKYYKELVDTIEKKEKDYLYLTSGRGIENRLIQSDKVLWKQGKRIRYYNINDYDFSELLDKLDLNQYNQIEYSTLKFFRMYPQLMKEYDIRDEYELHNLLKKICDPEKYKKLNFNRMPNIEFSKADRDNQVLELLIALSPISNIEFAKAYEEEYGVYSKTVLANYMKNFDKYFYDGVYKIDFKDLSNSVIKRLKEILTEDFYLFKEIKTIFSKEFPNEDINNINPLNIKSLGFNCYSTFAIKDKYKTQISFFKHIFTKDNKFDETLLSKRYSHSHTYLSTLYELKSSYDIIEYKPNKYINYKLLKDKATKKMIYEYVKSVSDFAKKNEYFSIASIKQKGFIHKLDELGFSNWFYSSLLTEFKSELSYIRIGGNKIFKKSVNNFVRSDFLKHLIKEQENESISLNSLIKLLNEKYDVKLSKEKIIENVRNNEMFYDRISKIIYKDYESYFKRQE